MAHLDQEKEYLVKINHNQSHDPSGFSLRQVHAKNEHELLEAVQKMGDHTRQEVTLCDVIELQKEDKKYFRFDPDKIRDQVKRERPELVIEPTEEENIRHQAFQGNYERRIF